MSEPEPKDPIEAYDATHGKPEATAQDQGASVDEQWGESLNPVRETPLAATGLKSVGK